VGPNRVGLAIVLVASLPIPVVGIPTGIVLSTIHLADDDDDDDL
jgi:hypothetical protein